MRLRKEGFCCCCEEGVDGRFVATATESYLRRCYPLLVEYGLPYLIPRTVGLLAFQPSIILRNIVANIQKQYV